MATCVELQCYSPLVLSQLYNREKLYGKHRQLRCVRQRKQWTIFYELFTFQRKHMPPSICGEHPH